MNCFLAQSPELTRALNINQYSNLGHLVPAACVLTVVVVRGGGGVPALLGPGGGEEGGEEGEQQHRSGRGEVC